MTQQNNQPGAILKASGVLSATFLAGAASANQVSENHPENSVAPVQDFVEFQAVKLTKALHEKHGGLWFYEINAPHDFAIVSKK